MTNDPRELKTRLKKLNALAMQAKMDLHDLSEDLPTGWEQIMVVAQRCHDAHAALMRARQTAVSARDSTSGARDEPSV
ncbi:CCE_0567 family metalloprotein [Paraburkholderia mimosarum]|uniref:CCE_0567 family metalloprotein n=1 Tax=Paraburkholderia mimosarum TaxID=312026 RepID=UPI00048636D4|nr:CCE_0567 family metalloprotein [Paraburkholderia mimosarum]